jgi:hypothetical protein
MAAGWTGVVRRACLPNLLGWAISEASCREIGVILAVLDTPYEENRIKCGSGAVFPQDD